MMKVQHKISQPNIRGAFIVLLLLAFFIGFLAPTTNATAVTFINPYQNYSYNYKGNIHAHSTNSDGTDSPTTVGQWYLNNGYDFYTITDHNYLTPDPGVSDILWLGKSEEGSLTGNTAHMGNLNINTVIPSSDAQTMISNAYAQGGQTTLHHIDRPDRRWSADAIKNLENLLGVEIYNGGGLNSTPTWDTVLTAGKSVWGTAGDDSHGSGGRGNGYLVVNSDQASPTASEILSEMAAGNFYASRGFDLSVSVTNNTITASTTSGNKIRWLKRSGRVIKTTSGTTDTYSAVGDEYYVRIEILDSSDNPKAWSQPLFISGASPPPALTPVYRFWNRNSRSHFYTASLSERNNVIAKWPGTYRYEGVAYSIDTYSASVDAPLYRFYNKTNGTHFYTASETERARVIATWPGVYRLEGVAYLIALDPSNSTPVYRFWNRSSRSHFYTASLSERNYVIATWSSTYRYEGVAYYLPNTN